MMLSHDRIDAPLALSFGKAKWLLLHETLDKVEFRRNESLSGGSVAGAIASAGCQDLIAAHLGSRAHEHLRALGVHVWKGPEATPAREVIEMFRRGELKRWEAVAGAGESSCSAQGGRHREHRAREVGGAKNPDPIVRLGRPPRGGG